MHRKDKNCSELQEVVLINDSSKKLIFHIEIRTLFDCCVCELVVVALRVRIMIDSKTSVSDIASVN